MRVTNILAHGALCAYYCIYFACNTNVFAQTLTSNYNDNEIIFESVASYKSYVHEVSLMLPISFAAAMEAVTVIDSYLTLLPFADMHLTAGASGQEKLASEYVNVTAQLKEDYAEAASYLQHDPEVANRQVTSVFAEFLESIPTLTKRAVPRGMFAFRDDDEPNINIDPCYYRTLSNASRACFSKAHMLPQLMMRAKQLFESTNYSNSHWRNKRDTQSPSPLQPYSAIVDKSHFYQKIATTRDADFIFGKDAMSFYKRIDYVSTLPDRFSNILDEGNKTLARQFLTESTDYIQSAAIPDLRTYLHLITEAQAGRVSRDLLDTQEIEKGLNSLSAHMAEEYAMTLASATVNSLVQFPVDLVSVGGKFFLQFTLPLNPTPKASSLLVPVKTSFTLHKLNRVLTVTPTLDNQLVLTTSPPRATTLTAMTKRCLFVASRYYCRREYDTFKTTSCAVALYRGDVADILRVCQWQLTHSFPHVQRLSNSEFVFSTPKRTKFIRTCPDNHSPFEVPAGVTKLDLDTCTAVKSEDTVLHRFKSSNRTLIRKTLPIMDLVTAVTNGAGIDTLYDALLSTPQHSAPLRSFRARSFASIITPDLDDLTAVLFSALLTIVGFISYRCLPVLCQCLASRCSRPADRQRPRPFRSGSGSTSRRRRNQPDA